MRELAEFSRYFRSGQWHTHTAYVDGEMGVAELAERIDALGVPLLAFTEHVRRRATYPLHMYLEEIDQARRRHPSMIILSGFEAKFLPGGKIDIPEGMGGAVDVVIGSFHSFPGGKEEMEAALLAAVKRRSFSFWGHPFGGVDAGIFPGAEGLDIIVPALRRAGIAVEENPTKRIRRDFLERCQAEGVPVLNGGDIHRRDQLR